MVPKLGVGNLLHESLTHYMPNLHTLSHYYMKGILPALALSVGNRRKLRGAVSSSMDVNPGAVGLVHNLIYCTN